MPKYIERSNNIKNEILEVLNSDLYTLINILPDYINFNLHVNNIGGLYPDIMFSGDNFMSQLKNYLFDNNKLGAEIKNYSIKYKLGYVDSFDVVLDETSIINIQGNKRGVTSRYDFNKKYSVIQNASEIDFKSVKIPDGGISFDELVYIIKTYDKIIPLYMGPMEIKLTNESRYKFFDIVEYKNPFEQIKNLNIYLNLSFYKYRTKSIKGKDKYDITVTDYYNNNEYSGD